MTLLTICQDAAAEIGVPEPSSVVNNTDANAALLYRLADRAGRDLMKEHDWQVLTKESSFTTVATESQGALTTIAPDFDRMIGDTLYNRTQKWQVGGPRTSADWQAEQGLASSSIRDTFRIRGGEIIMSPVPTAGESVYFEYVGNQWCQSSAEVGKTAFTLDDDTGVLDEDLIRLGVVWRFLSAKGFSYGEQKGDYEKRLSLEKARDGAASRLDLSGPGRSRRRVPEGSWAL